MWNSFCVFVTQLFFSDEYFEDFTLSEFSQKLECGIVFVCLC